MTVAHEDATTAVETPAEVERRLRSTFDGGRTRTLAWRQGQLAGLERFLREREKELCEALAADLRRTPFESVLFDTASVLPEIKHARKHLARWMKPRKVATPINVKPGRAWYQYEPLGVVMVIGAWNYPIHLTLRPMVGALAAGNCVVLKPSELAPASSAVLARFLPDYLDSDAIAVVEGGPDATHAVIATGLDHIFFTGSPRVGSLVMESAAKTLTPVTLELGGKCPVIVTASARLDVAARRVAFGKLVNSGQTCVAPDYVLVEESVRDAFVDVLARTMTEFSEGRRQPVVNRRHAERLANLLANAGGSIALGGTIDVDAAEALPTIVVDPAADAAVLTEEIFGPILPVITVANLDAALAHVRRGPKPLASYVFTESREEQDRAVVGHSAGGTVLNHVMMHLAVPDLPFGGVGNSGTGSYHGRWGFEAFSHAKAVLRQRTWPDPKLMYPPYSERAQRFMRRMM
jgi:aldehyde dehydrogenase (NAD+)